ncbi:MAG: HD domain-containing protein [Clostridiaceae bacterium]|nr:HD domain-containing protein [Clostridiaceae bacterium]
MEIMEGNNCAHSLLCSPYEHLEGKKIFTYLSAVDAEHLKQALQRGSDCITMKFCLNSWLGPKYCQGNLITDSDLNAKIFLFRDITATHELSEQLELHTGIQDMVGSVLTKARLVTDNELLKMFLEDTIRQIAELLTIDYCQVNIISNSEKIYVQYPAMENIEEYNENICNRWLFLLRNNPLHYINQSSTISDAESQFMEQRGLMSVLVFPIMSDNQLLGYLCIGSKNNLNLSLYAEKALRNVADIIGQMMETVKLRIQGEVLNRYYQSINEKSEQKSQRILQEIIKSLMMTMKIFDISTAEHSLRTTQGAMAIAKTLGMPEKSVQALQAAASIHDIGKISVPLSILNRPGKLTMEEQNIIKRHSQVGYEITKNIEFSGPVSQIILQHHERMDGSGYPAGLRGSDILMEARILAVADVFDAILFHAPYRDGWGKRAALKEIIKQKGILFDEDVVDAFIEVAKTDAYLLNVNNEKEIRIDA